MIILFDLFNTIYDVSDVPKKAMAAYGQCIEHYILTGKYVPMEIESWWRLLKPFSEARDALSVLMNSFHASVGMSNCPVKYQGLLAASHNLPLARTIPLSEVEIYKPANIAYSFAAGFLYAQSHTPPRECLMVTANKSFGDLEGAAAVGMQTYWLDRDGGKTLWDLGDHLKIER